MLSAKSLTIGAAVLLLQLHGVRADGAQEWTEAGFPAMAFIFGLLLIIMAIVKGYLHTRSAAGIKANAGLFATSWLVWFWAIFLIFGPGSGGLGSTTAANPTLGLLLIFQSALSMYACLCQHTPLHILHFTVGNGTDTTFVLAYTANLFSVQILWQRRVARTRCTTVSVCNTSVLTVFHSCYCSCATFVLQCCSTPWLCSVAPPSSASLLQCGIRTALCAMVTSLRT